MKHTPDFVSKLNASDPVIKNYIVALEKENLKLQKQVAKLQAQNVSQQNKIAILQKMQPKMVIKVSPDKARAFLPGAIRSPGRGKA